MSLITYGLAHLTLLTMGLGISFRTLTSPKPIEEAEVPKEIDFVNIPVKLTFQKKEVEK